MSLEKRVRNRYRHVYQFYSRPTFISGLASLFDLYNVKKSHGIYISYANDFKIISNDFKDVGSDIQKSLDSHLVEMDNRKIGVKISY